MVDALAVPAPGAEPRPAARTVLLAGGVALLATVPVVLLALSNTWGSHGPDPLYTAATTTVAAAFGFAGGLAWLTRPTHHTGPLLLLVAALYALPAISWLRSPATFTIALTAGDLFLIAYGHALLAFPNGRLRGRGERWLVAIAYGYTIGRDLLFMAIFDPVDSGCPDCPANLLLVHPDWPMAQAIQRYSPAVYLLTVCAFLVAGVLRWRASSAPQRWALGPALWGTGLALAVLATVKALTVAWVVQPWMPLVEALGLMALPAGMLVSWLRAQLVRARVADLVVRLAREPHVSDVDSLLRPVLAEPVARDAAQSAVEIALARQRLLAAVREERRRLERDLHDTAQQRLLYVATLVDDLARRVSEADPKLEPLVQSAAEELDRARAELRELSRGIHPVELSRAGLPTALRTLAARCPVPTTVDVRDGISLGEDLDAALYHMAAEALTNVARHSGARRAWLTLSTVDGRVLLEVRDDGTGAAVQPRTIAERAEALGGTVTVEFGQGTTVRVSLPCG